jgi:hypothetical protein
LSEFDLGGSFVLGWETYLTNEDRAAPDDLKKRSASTGNTVALAG